MEVLVDTFATLIEQATLMSSQKSLSMLHARRSNILNTAENDPRKEKTLLKEKVVILQLSKSHLFGKKFDHI